MSNIKKRLVIPSRGNTEVEISPISSPVTAQRRGTINLENVVCNFVSKHVMAYCKNIASRYVQDEIDEHKGQLKFEERASFSVASPETPASAPDSAKDFNSPVKLPVHMPYMRPSADEGFAAVVMADVSGYSKLSSILAEKGQGAEILGKVMKGYLDQIIHIILSHGGDIVKFVGDAVIFYWKLKPQSEDEDSQKMTSADIEQAKGEIVLKASHCCLELLKKLGTYPINVPDCDISVLRIHLGIGAGTIYDVHVGHAERWEHFIAGDGINQLATVLDLAKAGELALSHQALKYFSTVIDIASVNIGNYDKRCIILTGVENAKRKDVANSFEHKSAAKYIGEPDLEVKLSPMHRDREAKVCDELIKRFINNSALFKLQMDINQSKVFRIEAGVEELMALSELRQATTIFIKIGSMATTDEKLLLNNAQEAISIVEVACKKFEGSMRQFHVDDKGAVILLFFGLPPMAHTNDAIFGIKAAMDIKEKFERIFDNFSIGLTTGNISIGAVGNAFRTEYALMGDSINMAARLMCHAEAKLNVLCDEKSFKQCQDEYLFDALGETKVKGKQHAITIFRPKKPKNPTANNSKKAEDSKLLDIVGREREKMYITRALQTHITGTGSKLFVMEADGGLGLATMSQFAKKEAKSLGCKLCNAAGTELDRRNQLMIIRQFFCDLMNTTGHKYGNSDDNSNPNLAMRTSSKNILNRIESEDMGTKLSLLTKQSSQSLHRGAGGNPKFNSLKRRGTGKASFSADILPNSTNVALKHFSNASKQSNSNLNGRNAQNIEEKMIEAFIRLKEDPQSIPLLNLLFPGQFLENDYSSQFQGKVRIKEFTAVLCRLLNQMSEKVPVVILLEESQWIDLASWEVLWEIHEKCPDILLALFSRPDAQFESDDTRGVYSKFKKVPDGQIIVMEGLTRQDTEKMIMFSWSKHNDESPDHLTSVEENLLDYIYAKSNGNILYIDSLVFALKESGGCVVESATGMLKMAKLDFKFDKNMVVGDGLTSLIIAQLDRIDREFQLFLKVASVLGQRCLLNDVMFFLSDTPGVLQKLAYDEDNISTLVQKITNLDKYGYLNCIQDDDADVIVAFKSEIVRKCIYSTMILSQRQQLHYYVATYYEKLLNDSNRNRLLIQIYEHYALSDEKQILKKLRYLEAVANYYYEESMMKEAIEHYSMLIEQAEDAQNKADTTLHSKDVRARWHLELGDAFYTRGAFTECEINLRHAINLSGYSFPTSEAMYKLLLKAEMWRRIPLLMSSVQKAGSKMSVNTGQKSNGDKAEGYLKEIRSLPMRRMSVSQMNSGDARSLHAVIQQQAANSNTSAALASKLSTEDVRSTPKDKSLRSKQCVRKALMVLSQVFFKQGRFCAHQLAVLTALRFSREFASDSFYAQLLSMKAHVILMSTGNQSLALQCVTKSLQTDRKDNAIYSVRIVQNAVISLMSMGYWDVCLQYIEILGDLANASSKFNHRVEALRLKALLLFMNGSRAEAIGVSRDLYNQSWNNDDFEGKLSGCQMALANVLGMSSSSEEIQDLNSLIKNNWELTPPAIKGDPAIALVQYAVMAYAEVRMQMGVNVNYFLTEFESSLDQLISRSPYVLSEYQQHGFALGTGRFWLTLVAFVQLGHILLHYADKGDASVVNIKTVFRVCRKVSKYLKNSQEMKHFVLAYPIRMWIKGIKFVFETGTRANAVTIWKEALSKFNLADYPVAILNAAIANYSTESDKTSYVSAYQKSFKNLGVNHDIIKKRI